MTWKLLFIQRVDWDFYFPISDCWKYCIGGKKTQQNIIIILRIVLQLYSKYSQFLSGTNMQRIQYAFIKKMFSLFFFCLLFSLYMSWKCYLHGTGRFFASVDPLMLFNTLWFCLYCIYCNFFSSKRLFWGRPQTFGGQPVKEAGLVLFTGYPPPLRLQSCLLCTCVTEAPN